MSWGTDLWDQIGNLEKHTEKGIDFLEKFSHFVKERQKIENEYASQLKKLHRSYFPKKKEEEEYKYSSQNAFKQILQEMHSIANQHELIGEYLLTNVTKEVQMLVTELRAERKKHIQDFKQEDNNLEKSIKKMDSTKGTYKNSHDAWVQAKQQYEKANDDMNQTKAQVEKYRQTMNAKSQHKSSCKDNYILQLDQTNKDQREFYYTKIPDIFNKIQEMDERRNQRLGEFYKLYAEGHRQVLPLVNNCLDTMTAEAEKINTSADSRLTIERYKTGHSPPDDIEMIDFDQMQRKESELDAVSVHSFNNGTMSSMAMRKRQKKGTIFGMFGKKEEPKEDFSHLPPNQQTKKLREKIDELSTLIESEVKAKEGLQRMREVYTKNPTLGDPVTVDRQLAEIGKKMDGLRMELAKYQNYLAHAEGKAPTPQGTPQGTPQSTPHGTPQPAGKGDDLDRASERPDPYGADTPQTITELDGPQNSSGEPLSPGWGGQNSFDEPDEPVGKCRAVYQFDTEDDNLLSMVVGEELDVIERDSGDGWTRVRRGEEEGYVPTTYVENM